MLLYIADTYQLQLYTHAQAGQLAFGSEHHEDLCKTSNVHWEPSRQSTPGGMLIPQRHAIDVVSELNTKSTTGL